MCHLPAGQEPLNSVLYRDAGDEYRPHCDGLCAGGQYTRGRRVATAILYCEARGGGVALLARRGTRMMPRGEPTPRPSHTPRTYRQRRESPPPRSLVAPLDRARRPTRAARRRSRAAG